MHYKRRYPRTSVGKHKFDKWKLKKYDLKKYNAWYHGGWVCNYPRWWDIVFHTRPHRRVTAKIARAVMRDLDADAALWPLRKKPHKYYW